MDAVMSPIQELEDAAHASASIQLWAEFVIAKGHTLRVELRGKRSGSTWSGAWSYANARRGSTSIGPGGSSQRLGDAIRQVAAAYPKAVLEPGSIGVKVQKGPLGSERMLPLVVQAWYEAFRLPIPARDELVAAEKAKKAALKINKSEVVTQIRSGKDGVAAFNRRPLAERNDSEFKGADLAGCKLDGILFAGANLARADLSEASLVNAAFGPGRVTRGLNQARLVGADLSGAVLDECSCTEADFTGARLAGASLKYCHLWRARFVDADLSKANLNGSNVQGVDFTRANLTGAILKIGEYDEQTKWPGKYSVPDTLTWKGAGPDPRKVATKSEKARPRPTNFPGFLARLTKVTDPSKLAKALAMLKAERFQLFAMVQDDQLVGVVKSQSEANRVYSCRLTSQGVYSCCTQNLNVCGGLRGSPCKHLLVLIVGLANAGELDPGTAHEWTQASRGRKPELDRDATTETFLQYKGAEAGEIDWRPTDTLPEDFYTM